MAAGIVWNVFFLLFFVGIICLLVGQLMVSLQIWSVVNVLEKSIPCGTFPVSSTYKTQPINSGGYNYTGTLTKNESGDWDAIISWTGNQQGHKSFVSGVKGLNFDPTNCSLTFKKLSDGLKQYFINKNIKINPKGRVNENKEIIGDFSWNNFKFNVVMIPVTDQPAGIPPHQNRLPGKSLCSS